MLQSHKKILFLIEYYQPFIQQALSFFVAKASLTFCRWTLILFSFYKLNTLEFSILASIFSLIEILRIFCEFGTEAIIYSRLNKGNKISAIVKTLVEFRLFLSIIIFSLFYFLCQEFFDYNVSYVFLLLPMFSVQTSSFVFLQREKNLKSIIIIGLSTIFTMSAVYAFLASKEINLEGMAKILLIPDIITALICLVSTKKYWLELNINIFNVLKKTKKILMSLFLSGSITLTIVLYSRLDLILVRPYLGFEQQAVYSYAFRFVEPFSICFSLLALSLLAEMSAVKNILITGKYKNFIRKYLSKKYVILFIFLNVLLALFLCGIAEKFLAFNNHKILIFTLAMVIFIKFINTIFSTYFLRKQNYIYLLKISVINLLVIFFMGLILGFSFGNTGIALASIIGEATIFFLQRKALVSKL